MSSSPSFRPLHELMEFQKKTLLADTVLELGLPDFPILIRSNSTELLKQLQAYFGDLITEKASVPEKWPNDQIVKIYQSEPLLPLIEKTPWQDWLREPGKTGRKDAFYDTSLESHPIRLLQKVKTGMLFIQPAPDAPFTGISPTAWGPAETHNSQIINFILTQYLNHHLRHCWLLAHTSGMLLKGKGVAFAGLSGGGKSTLMLHLLEEGEHFISNDRLLITTHNGKLKMRGIPKQPRINPGTIVHNPRLHGLMTEHQRREFLAMPQETLRQLEQKYDAPVDQLYHADCYRSEAPLDALVILNWSARSEQPTRLNEVDLNRRTDLLPAVMKTPGPFYAPDAKGFLKNGFQPNPEDYLEVLKATRVFEITGKIDFPAAERQLLEQIKTL